MKNHLLHMIKTLTHILTRKKAMATFLALFFLSGCAAFQEKKKTTLLLEEIQKETASKGKEIDSSAVWIEATIKRRWVPGRFKSNRIYVHGHYEDYVETPGHWKAQ